MTDITTFKQANIFTTAKYPFTTLEKDIMIMVLSQLKEGSKERYYHVSAKDIADKAGAKLNINNFVDACDKLQSRNLKLVRPNGNLLSVQMVSSAEYLKGSGVMEIEISEKLLPFLVNLSAHFTLIDFEVILSLRKKSSKRLYELLCQYRDTGWVYLSIIDLKGYLDLIDEYGNQSYDNWYDLKVNSIDPAIKEINNNTDIKLSYEVRKIGKKVIGIDFKFEPRPYQKQINFSENQIEFVDRLKAYGLANWQVKWILSNCTEDEINKKLYKIQIDKSNVDKSSLGGYASAIFGCKTMEDANKNALKTT
jgi:plasmid replication initiation protein